MIEESYVKYGTASMLKEAGFNVPTRTHYYAGGKFHFGFGQYDWNNFAEGHVTAPTQQLAIEWLLKEKQLLVAVSLPKKDKYLATITNTKDLSVLASNYYDEYNKAVEYGIVEALCILSDELIK